MIFSKSRFVFGLVILISFSSKTYSKEKIDSMRFRDICMDINKRNVINDEFTIKESIKLIKVNNTIAEYKFLFHDTLFLVTFKLVNFLSSHFNKKLGLRPGGGMCLFSKKYDIFWGGMLLRKKDYYQIHNLASPSSR